MTVQMIASAHRQVAVDAVGPLEQAGTNAAAVVTGSEVDARGWRSLAYTIAVADETLTWTVYGANQADFADEVVVNAGADVAAGAASSYAVAQAPYAYYRVKIVNKVADVVGTATVSAILKG